MHYRKFTFIPLLLLLITFGACSAEKDRRAAEDLNDDQLIEDLRVLSSDEMEGRRTGTEGNRKAMQYLVQRFEESGASAFRGSYTHPFDFVSRGGDSLSGTNVIAMAEGRSDSIIVITAHYDHLGMQDSLIFNGADDDASGTAALLAFADYFADQKPDHTLLFAAFDAEEMGLQGARAFVKDSLLMQKVVLNINMDMISQNSDNELYASGTYHYPELKPVLDSLETGSVELLFGHDRPEQGYDDWTSASDHGAFHARGIPFIYFGVEDHEHYHQSTDEFESIPQEFYKNSVRVIFKAVKAFDQR